MKTPNNIDKPVPGRGNNEATKEILLAVDKEKLEFDAMNDILDTLMEEFKKEAKHDTSFLDWLKSKDKDYHNNYPLINPYDTQKYLNSVDCDEINDCKWKNTLIEFNGKSPIFNSRSDFDINFSKMTNNLFSDFKWENDYGKVIIAEDIKNFIVN